MIKLINYKKILKILIRLLKHLITLLKQGTQLTNSSTGQVRARRMMMVWIGVKIYKRHIEPIKMLKVKPEIIG